MLTWPLFFSEFFSEKIISIRHALNLDIRPCVFSVNFNVHPRMITTVLLHFEHVPLQRLQEIINKTKKTYCFLDQINVSKVESIYMFAAPFIKKR